MNEIKINELKMYSPNQVFLGSILGGPLAMLYFLWANFKTIGKLKEAKYTVIYGALFTLALILFLRFVPEQIPGAIAQCTYSFVALIMVDTLQMNRDEVRAKDNYSFQSNWRVLAYAVGLYLMWLATIYPVTNFLVAIGVVG